MLSGSEHPEAEAEKEKIPYMAIVGEREEKEHSISVRERHRKNRGSMTVEEFLNELQEKLTEEERPIMTKTMALDDWVEGEL